MSSPGKDISMSSNSGEMLEEGSSTATSNKHVTTTETPHEDDGVKAEMPLKAIGRTEHMITIQDAPPEQVELYRKRLGQMGEALTCKGVELTEAKATNTIPAEIKTIVGQLTDLRCSYEGWASLVAQASLPNQHLTMEKDIQARLVILGLVYNEPQRLLMARDQDPI